MTCSGSERTTIAAALHRRKLLAGAAAGGIAIAAGRARAQAPVAITMSVWGAQAEEDAFRAVLARYKEAHPEITVKLEVNGSSAQVYQQVDTRLAGRQAPDIFRVQYQQLGRYASARALVDLSSHVDSGYAASFAPAFWRAVNFKGRPYALPHHTDTFALYYDRDMLRKVGVEPPDSLEKSWSWQDFIRIARDLKGKAGVPYGFAMSWQGTAAYRWLVFLYQHGGQLLSDDLGKAQLAQKPGIETIAWTQSWFKEGLVPPSTAIKSAEQPQNLFANGTIGMLIGGDWQIPFLDRTKKTEWGVTYMPRDVAMASDLGGNALAVTRDTKHPDIAADLVKFFCDEGNMQEFVTRAQFLPVRTALMSRSLPYTLRPDAMAVFTKQASTIPPHLVSTVTLPNFAKINAILTDQLDLAFTSGQDPATTAKAIDEQTQALLSA